MTLSSVFLFLGALIDFQTESEPSSSISSGDIWAIVFILVIIIAIVHMFISFKLKRFEPITVEETKQQRLASSMSELATNEENELAMDYLEDIFDHWSDVSKPDEEQLKAPTRKIHIEKSLSQLGAVKDILPTDDYVVERLNELGDVVNSNSKRSFSGSKSLIIVSLILTVFMYFTLKTDTNSFLGVMLKLWWLWGSIIFYIVASYSPQFLIDKRLRKLGSGNFSSGLVGFFTGMFIGAPTFSYITKYSDGSSSRSTAFNLIGLFLMLVGLMILGMFIVFFGLLNYLRNFILYI
jgi:hypothetical protein